MLVYPELEVAQVTNHCSLLGNLLTPMEKHADAVQLPDPQGPSIYSYLINTSSGYTKDNMKAYKSLDCYKYFVADWVHGMQTWNVPEETEGANDVQRMYQPALISNRPL